MRSMIRHWGAKAALGAAAAGAVAWAASGTVADEACAGFSMIAGKQTVDIVDHGASGDSVGNTRIMTRELTDEGGREFAIAYFVSTLVDTDDGGEARFVSNVHIVFRNGEMSGAVSYTRPNDETPFGKPLNVLVNGGTGFYEGAEGSIEITADAPPIYQFHIYCT